MRYVFSLLSSIRCGGRRKSRRTTRLRRKRCRKVRDLESAQQGRRVTGRIGGVPFRRGQVRRYLEGYRMQRALRPLLLHHARVLIEPR